MKIAIVYTGITPEMMSLIERELKSATAEEHVDILTYTDPTIINETIANSKVTNSAAKRLVKMYMDATTAGAEVIYNICSSIGDVADASKNVFKMMGVPLIRVDEAMAIGAIKTGRKIGVLATLNTTLEPTKKLLTRCAEAMNADIELIDALADGAYGKSGEELEEVLVETARKIADQVDVILLAQVSMAMCEEKIAKATGKKVVSSPRFGAVAVAEAIKAVKELSV